MLGLEGRTVSEQLWGHLDLALAGLVPGVLFGPGVSIPVSHQRICNISGSKPLSIFPGLDGAEWKGGWTWSAHVLANTASAWEQKEGLTWNRWMSAPPLTVSPPSPAQDKERYNGETCALGPDVS